jgi:hypothetical protein
MELVCLSSSKDLLLTKSIISLLPDRPTLVEEDQRLNPTFSIYPVLKINHCARYFGLRAIIKHLFTGTPHLPPASLSIIESLISLSDSIFAASVPIIVKKLTILLKAPLLQSSHVKLSKLLSIAVPLAADIEANVGTVYLSAILSIVSSFGVDISPATASPVDIEGITDECISFAHDV